MRNIFNRDISQGVVSKYLAEMENDGFKVNGHTVKNNGEGGNDVRIDLRTPEGDPARIWLKTNQLSEHGHVSINWAALSDVDYQGWRNEPIKEISIPITNLKTGIVTDSYYERALMDMTGYQQNGRRYEGHDKITNPDFARDMASASQERALESARRLKDIKPAADVLHSLASSMAANETGGQYERPKGMIEHGPLAGKMDWEEGDRILKAYGNGVGANFGLQKAMDHYIIDEVVQHVSAETHKPQSFVQRMARAVGFGEPTAA